MNNENKKIVGYNTQTGEPIYEEIKTSTSKLNDNSELVNQYQQNLNQDYVQQPSNKKSHINLFIIIGTILLIVVLAIVIVVLLVKKSDNEKSHQTINEYENNTSTKNNSTNTNSSDSNTNTNNSSNTQIYNGFEFEKVTGFTYSLYNDYLMITGPSGYLFLNAIQYNYSFVKLNRDELVNNLEQSGGTVKDYGIKTVSGTEILTYEVSDGENNVLYCVIASPDDSYVFEAYIYDANDTINYDTLEDLVKIVNNSKYVGNYSDYATDFNYNLTLNEAVQ